MADLGQIYDKLVDYYDAELNKEFVPIEVLKEARELLKAMKYEAPLIAGSKTEEVNNRIRDLNPPNFKVAN